MTEKLKSKISIRGSKEQVFDSITDYRKIDSYTDDIRIAGRGRGEGTRVYFKLSKDVLNIPTNYTTKIEFVEYNPPDQIEWKIIGDIDAKGSIRLTENSGHTDLILDFSLNLEKTDIGSLPAPDVADASQILEYIYPQVYEQASSIIKGVVTDIEGEPRDVNIEVINSSRMFSDIV